MVLVAFSRKQTCLFDYLYIIYIYTMYLYTMYYFKHYCYFLIQGHNVNTINSKLKLVSVPIPFRGQYITLVSILFRVDDLYLHHVKILNVDGCDGVGVSCFAKWFGVPQTLMQSLTPIVVLKMQIAKG